MIRRITDILIAVPVLILLSPVFLLVSIVIMIDSPGAPFYGGWRAGKDGVRFRMWKFRTMVKNADRIGGFITTPGDPRITGVGSFLRATKIDELPQFFNLLMGDLTLVGPRAEEPFVVERYTSEQKLTIKVKPGITGPGQLYYTTDQAATVPGDISADQFYLDRLLNEKLQVDIDYLKKRTPLSDCRVVWRTIALMAKAFANAVRTQRAVAL